MATFTSCPLPHPSWSATSQWRWTVYSHRNVSMWNIHIFKLNGQTSSVNYTVLISDQSSSISNVILRHFHHSVSPLLHLSQPFTRGPQACHQTYSDECARMRRTVEGTKQSGKLDDMSMYGEGVRNDARERKKKRVGILFITNYASIIMTTLQEVCTFML